MLPEFCLILYVTCLMTVLELTLKHRHSFNSESIPPYRPFSVLHSKMWTLTLYVGDNTNMVMVSTDP